MDKYILFNLIDSLQEIPNLPLDLIAGKTVSGIKEICEPLAVKIRIDAPNKQVFRDAAGDLTHLDLLKQYESKFADLDVPSAQFIIDDINRRVITFAGIRHIHQTGGIISTLMTETNPFKHLIRQILELYAGNITLAFALRLPARKFDLGGHLLETYPEMKKLGVEGVFAMGTDKPGKGFWIDNRGLEPVTISQELTKMLTSKERTAFEQSKKEICSYLPVDSEPANIIGDDFKAHGEKYVVLLAGAFENPQSVIARFRSLAADLAKPTEYEEIARALDLIRRDHKDVVKGERIAAILETAVAINHEINNPLTAILGNAQLILLHKQKLPEDMIAKINIIEKSALRIRQVTQKLLSVVEPITTRYTDKISMLDIDKSSSSETQEE